MKHFFTSDTHYGHQNILRYCSRPFKSLEEMDSTMIKRHNERVKPEDTVYFLGDFCFRNTAGGKEGEGTLNRADYYLNQLNGNFVFIRGNHDKNNSLKTAIESAVITLGKRRIQLIHRPEMANINMYNLILCGHVHQNWVYKNIYDPESLRTIEVVNVGVDVWNFYPVTFDEIMSLTAKKRRSHADSANNNSDHSNGSVGASNA